MGLSLPFMLWLQFRTIESLSFLHLFFAIFTVIPSVLQTKHLRTPSNMFVVNLAISDLGMMTTQAWKNWENIALYWRICQSKFTIFMSTRKRENQRPACVDLKWEFFWVFRTVKVISNFCGKCNLFYVLVVTEIAQKQEYYAILCRWLQLAQLAKGKKSRP